MSPNPIEQQVAEEEEAVAQAVGEAMLIRRTAQRMLGPEVQAEEIYALSVIAAIRLGTADIAAEIEEGRAEATEHREATLERTDRRDVALAEVIGKAMGLMGGAEACCGPVGVVVSPDGDGEPLPGGPVNPLG